MFELSLVLTPIALLDSTSIVPLCLVFLITLLAGPSPLLASSLHVAGVFVVYLGCGLLLMFGLEAVFDQLNAYAVRLWNDPYTEELIFQIVIGLILCALAFRTARARKPKQDASTSGGMTPVQAFVAGAGLTIVGLPGAVPYFAAVDLILRADITGAQQVSALVIYNLVFVAPLAAVIVLRLALGERSVGVLNRITQFLDRWGRRAMIAALLVVGVVLVADGIGWFLGHPLLPIQNG